MTRVAVLFFVVACGSGPDGAEPTKRAVDPDFEPMTAEELREATDARIEASARATDGTVCAGVSVPDDLRRCTADDECTSYQGPRDCSEIGARSDAEWEILKLIALCGGEGDHFCTGAPTFGRYQEGLCQVR